MSTVINIKGMVCRHYVRAVTAAFDTAGIAGAQVSLGHAVVPHSIHPERLDILDRELAAGGFARITDHETATVEKTLLALPGVGSVTVDLSTGRVTVEGTATPATVSEAIANAGFTCPIPS